MLIQGTDGGMTCYVGAPSSEYRIRVYDKGVESGKAPAGEKWRFEVQLRRVPARRAYSQILRSDDADSCIQAIVHEYCRAAGIVVPHTEHQRPSSEGDEVLPADAFITMHWLETQVRPSVLKLLKRVPVEQIKAALGLSELADGAVVQPDAQGGSDGDR
jgi:DNA relaxase NicK